MKRILFSLVLLIFLIVLIACIFNGWVELKDFLSLIWFIPLTIVALFQEDLKHYLSAPKLKIEFELKEPYCLKTEMHADCKMPHGGSTMIKWDAYYFRFRIRNMGKSQARLCECVAEKLWFYDQEGWSEDRTFQAINLNWSNAKSKDEFLNINPNSPGWFCDLIHLEQGQGRGMKIDYKMPYPNSQYNEIIPKAKHKILVAVYSENAKPVFKEFEIFWSGDWNDVSEKMFKEVIIK